MFQSGQPCCRPVRSSPDLPVRAQCACLLASPRLFQSRGLRCFLASSGPRMLQSVAPCLPSFSFLLCLLSVDFLCAAPSSPSPLSSRFMFLVPFLFRSLLLFMFSVPFLAAAASSCLCCPGRSNPRPLLSRMFQSGLCALVRLPLRHPGRSSPVGPVALWLLPGTRCISPWHRAFLFFSFFPLRRLSPSVPLLRPLLLSHHGSCLSSLLPSVPCSSSCFP